MRTLVIECPDGTPHLVDAFRGRAEIEGLLAAAPLGPGRSGAVLLFRTGADLQRFVADHERTYGSPARATLYDATASVAIDRPVFIVGAPRSGTTLLLDLLLRVPAFWTAGGEGLGIYDASPSVRAPTAKPSHRLVAGDASAAVSADIRAGFIATARNRFGTLLVERPAAELPTGIRLLEKTPRNALRIPFVRAIFPSARFIYLHRNPEENIGSLVDGWHSGRFVSHREGSISWSFLMAPGWRDVADRSVPEIAAFQWLTANACILDDLEAVPPSQWCAIDFADFLRAPKDQVRRLCAFAEVAMGPSLAHALDRPLPWSRSTLTAPAADKWRRHEAAIQRVLPEVQPTRDRLAQLARIATGEAAAG
jgi:hypothetical protein